MTTKPSSKRPRFSFKARLGFIVLIILLFFLVAEAGLRIAGFWYFIPREHIRFQCVQTTLGKRDSMIRFSSSTFWELSPGVFPLSAGHTYRINSHGFRGKAFARTKEKGVLRVCCMGDSSTFGLFIREEETYPYLLQKALSERRPGKYEVINCGIPGYSSFQGLHQLKSKVLSLDPDLITFYFGFNDMTPAVSLSDSEAYEREQTFSARLLNSLSLLRTFQLVYKTVKGEKEGDAQRDPASSPVGKMRVAQAEFIKNLEQFTALVKQKRSTLVLLTYPISPKRKKPSRLLDGSYNTILRMFSKSLAHSFGARMDTIPMVDLFKDFTDGGVENLFIDDVHPNLSGCQRIAESLMDKFQRMGFLD